MAVTLRRIDEFRQILEDYRPSKEAVELLRAHELVIFLGVTASGRNTIINHLVDTGRYHFIVSDTTRPPRLRNGVMERNGVEYFFRTEDEMVADLKDGKFLEAEVIHNQQVSGISIRELRRAIESGKIPVNEVDIMGTANIMKVKPDAKMFFIIPPSYDIWIERLNKRETMSSKELSNRFESAIRILNKALEDENFRFIINDSSLESAARIDAEVHGKSNESHHQEALIAAKKILQDFLAARG